MRKQKAGSRTYLETLAIQHEAVSAFLPGNWSARLGQIVGTGGTPVAAGLDSQVAQYLVGLHNSLPGILRYIEALKEGAK